MGKVVVSSEDEEKEEDVQETGGLRVGNISRKDDRGDGAMTAAAVVAAGSSHAVGWKRFLPKMMLRVLLVEADDSTRQIIAALLSKCSYKVASVSDGLKAWEVLRGRPENIDLILTEVELPSISGYALLTLIMEHDACKNIPVIMMSSQDSISMVYKCMLRGAADFLVKPVRKNELKNLWQHFWRKQALSSGDTELPDESVAQPKAEATAENKDDSNHSSDSMQCIMRNGERTEKGSDAQSSSTIPDLDSEKTKVEHGHCVPHEITRKISNDLHIPSQEGCHQENLKTKSQGKEASCNILTVSEQDKASSSNTAKNHVQENPSREAIDLIGAFDNYEKSAGSVPFGGSPNTRLENFGSSPHLDLSLKRSSPTGHVNQINEEHRLNHSDASAFYRYIGKQLHTSSSTCDQQKNQEINSDKKCATSHVPVLSPVFLCQPEPSETTLPCPHQREKTLPIPVKGIRFENVINTCNFMIQNPVPANHLDSTTLMNQLHPLDHPSPSSQQVHNLVDRRIDDVSDQFEMKKAQKLEAPDDKANLFSVGNTSATSSFCAGNNSNHPIHEVSAFRSISEHGNEKGLHVDEGSSHRLTQREAALNKFRLKRKDRCFEKKVRYESRKKLAEQRPRVKGQFVRQVPNHGPQPGNSSTG